MEDNTSRSSPPPHPELSYTTIPLNTPATEIRLLELFPSADFSSPLQCRLYNTPISSPAPFKALSYAWGSDDKTHLIYIDSSNATSDNGNDADADADADANLASGLSVINVSSDDNEVNTVDGGGAGAEAVNGEERADLDPNPNASTPGMAPTKAKMCIIRITSSLDTCLRHLRAIHHRDHQDDGQSLTLWIDQLCIDQSNPDEKAVQVGLMSQIYSRAKQVPIWLGPAADGSDEVMDALGQLGREFESVGVELGDYDRFCRFYDLLIEMDLDRGGGDGEDCGGGGGGGEGAGEKRKGGGGEDGGYRGEVEDKKNRKKGGWMVVGKEGKEMGGGSGIGVGAGTGTTCGDNKVVDVPGDGNSVEVGSDLGVGVGVADEEALDGATVVCTTNKADASTGKTVMAVVEDGAARLVHVGVSGELQAFFRRPWFTRVWVVQESWLCADTVFVCGTKPPVSYDICGAIALCMIPATREFMRRGGFLPEWDGMSPISNDEMVEMAGVRISPDMARALLRLAEHTDQSYQNRHCRLQQMLEGEGGNDLFRVLVGMYTNAHSSREAKLHRDRIYALLGVAADVDELEIKPDYSSQTRTAQILTEVAKAIIGKTKNGFPADLLSYSQFPKTILDDGSNEQLPSWVPDWRSGLQFPFYSYIDDKNVIRKEEETEADKEMFIACGPHRSVEMVPNTTAGMLGLRGYLVDTIEEVGGMDMVYIERFNFSPKPQVFDQFFEKLDRLWELSKQKNEPIYETPARREEALWRVPVGDMAFDVQMLHYRAKADWALEYHKWRRTLEQYQALDMDLALPGWWADCVDEDKKKKVTEWGIHLFGADGGKDYPQTISNMWRARKDLYLTKKGYMGIGPSDMQPGDVVVVFPGARIPFVLRPTSEEATFTYLGDAYCDGIMDGEITLREERREFFLV